MMKVRSEGAAYYGAGNKGLPVIKREDRRLGVSPELCRVWFNFSTGKYDVHVDGQVVASFDLHSDAVAYTITMRS